MKVDNNIQILEKQNAQIENAINTQESVGEVTIDNVDSLVKPSDPVSGKIIKSTAKYNALEECMAAIKKAYDKDVISLTDYLTQIRQLSKK